MTEPGQTQPDTVRRVGFIGLGNVGAQLAGSLLRNGFDLIVHDLDRAAAAPLLEKGASWADRSRELAEACDLVITCLPSPASCSEVMEGEGGVLEGLGPDKLWLEMSTTDAQEVVRLGKLVEQLGAIALDAPVSGGCHRAATGNIAVFVGGPRAAFERALPALGALGRRILHTGELGSASSIKVVTNYLASVHLAALGEALMAAKQSGMDLATAFEAIRVSSGNSFVHETESQVILSGSYNVNFTMDLVMKDLGLFQSLAEHRRVPTQIAPLVHEIFADGQERYGARAWSTMIVKRLEDACGCDLRADGFPAALVDDEPEIPGLEVHPRSAGGAAHPSQRTAP